MGLTDNASEVVLGKADIDDALALSDEANWNQTEADWGLFMAPGTCFGIHGDDRLVASAAVLPFGEIGWISMVLVTTDWRRRGLASKLMGRCIREMRDRNAASLLDATPDGAKVYGQLGFRTCCGMTRWRGVGLGHSKRPHAVVERQTVLDLDRQAFGGDRAFLLEDFCDRPGGVALGDARSFIMIRRGRRATQIGPLVAASAPEGQELLDMALATVAGAVIIDLLDAGSHLRPSLERRGMEAFRTFERMVLDRRDLPGAPDRMLIAAGPEFG
ncbi:GNAT family N-acetyltransferase [Mesorhizobium marinum]|uniref:GNAT family N-acetyltransferase n=1 Tax=Mesorhizobium marinum TaxID=3228790 RepID=A0ABV3R1Z1_9HYPH